MTSICSTHTTAAGRRLHFELVVDAPAPEALCEVVRGVEAVDLGAPAEHAHHVLQTSGLVEKRIESDLVGYKLIYLEI